MPAIDRGLLSSRGGVRVGQGFVPSKCPQTFFWRTAISKRCWNVIQFFPVASSFSKAELKSASEDVIAAAVGYDGEAARAIGKGANL